MLREYPGTLPELREWPLHSESVFPEIGVVPRLLSGAFLGVGKSPDLPFLQISSEGKIRAACLQNEIAPEKLLNRYEKWFEKREKRSEKRSETRPKNVYPLSGRLKIFHWHFSTHFKSFSPPEICTKTKKFTARLSEVATLRKTQLASFGGPLNRLNAILSLLHPLDRYRTPSAIGSAIGRLLARPISHPNTGRSSQPPRSEPLSGLSRAIVVL